MNYTNEEYSKFVESKSPDSKLWRNMLFAFLIGGLICTIGQAFGDIYKYYFNADEELVKGLVPITMIFIGALLTGLNLYDNIAKYGGAGTLVPITGFSNAVVSPAMEFKSEGFILGTAAKMFIIAGPVLVYGTVGSVLVGILYYIYFLNVK